MFKNKTSNHKFYINNKSRYTRRRRNKHNMNTDIIISKCNPSLKNKIKDTCFTKDIIEEIKREYNLYNPGNKIKFKNPNRIINEIKQNTKCNDEHCWLQKLPHHFKKNVIDYLYRPVYPTYWEDNNNGYKNKWLSNFDILAVLKQYEDANKNFKFIGPTFIDFDEKYEGKCVENELCHFNINNYIDKNINKIGIIFNLDKHTQSGSHWVSLFIDLNENFIFYFNSTGQKTPGEIKILIDRIINQYKTLKKVQLKYLFNKLEHQQGDTECGMYSLFFIISMLTDTIGGDDNKPFDDFTHKIKLFTNNHISDKEMENLRDKYFIKK